MQFFHGLFPLNLILVFFTSDSLLFPFQLLHPSLSLSLHFLSLEIMDSGNSGSVQSSSGGDDQEFDSRGGESISSFINAPHNFGSISASAASAPPPPFLSQQNPNFFDPNLYTNDSDLIWSRALRSDHHHAFSALGNNSSPSPPISFPAADIAAPRAAAPPPPPQTRNPKKRTRASRRAPTTVLTTDTSNFRQMVQEFTGIPAAPFSGGSPYSRRLDLFSAASALRSGPIYPLRPAANKVLSPFSPSPPLQLHNAAMIDAIVPTTTITNPNNSGGASTSNNPNNFQMYQQHGIPPLQLGANSPMNFSNLSGFISRDGGASSAAAVAAQMRGNDDLDRWKSGETVRNNENLIEFDGRNINSGESQNYNLNIAEKGRENAAAAASSAAEGTSWILPSD